MEGGGRRLGVTYCSGVTGGGLSAVYVNEIGAPERCCLSLIEQKPYRSRCRHVDGG